MKRLKTSLPVTATQRSSPPAISYFFWKAMMPSRCFSRGLASNPHGSSPYTNSS